MRISFNPLARAELVEGARWYANEAGASRAGDFRQEIQRSLRLAIEHPALASPAVNNTRRLQVHRFPYSVIYRADGDMLRVLAVAHHSRRPGYWAGRR
ncbi:MAG: hypothetical protein ABS92_15970 [Thiobacillus sp. SCN 63-374]|nr:MAG: hypothetical protein ABS92_15970 [Thiobacillus sp. SCN 63-374]